MLLGARIAKSTWQPYTLLQHSAHYIGRMEHSTKPGFQLRENRVQHHQIIHWEQQLNHYFISTLKRGIQSLPEEMDRRIHHDLLIRVNNLSLVLFLTFATRHHLVIAVVQRIHDETNAPSSGGECRERSVHLVHQHHNATRIRNRDVVIENLVGVWVIQHRFADLPIRIQPQNEPASKSPPSSSRKSSPSATGSFRRSPSPSCFPYPSDSRIDDDTAPRTAGNSVEPSELARTSTQSRATQSNIWKIPTEAIWFVHIDCSLPLIASKNALMSSFELYRSIDTTKKCPCFVLLIVTTEGSNSFGSDTKRASTFVIELRCSGVPYLYRDWIIRLPSCFRQMSTIFPESSFISFSTNTSLSSLGISVSRKRFQISFAYNLSTHLPRLLWKPARRRAFSSSSLISFSSAPSLLPAWLTPFSLSSSPSIQIHFEHTLLCKKRHFAPFVHLEPNLHSTIIYTLLLRKL